jgi:hypothetical protein
MFARRDRRAAKGNAFGTRDLRWRDSPDWHQQSVSLDQPAKTCLGARAGSWQALHAECGNDLPRGW